MAGIKQAEPWLPEKFEIVTEDIGLFYRSMDDDERIGNAYFKNLAVEHEDFTGLCFSRVKFENCSFIGCSFEKAEFSDVILRSCNFSNCILNDSFWRRAVLQASKGTGLKMTGSSLKDVTITDCSMTYANFDDSKLEGFRVEDSDFGNANLAQCKCKNVIWNHVNFHEASFFKTALKGMDFTTCDLKGLVLSDECTEVRGAVMDLYQAAELAKRLGIVIK